MFRRGRAAPRSTARRTLAHPGRILAARSVIGAEPLLIELGLVQSAGVRQVGKVHKMFQHLARRFMNSGVPWCPHRRDDHDAESRPTLPLCVRPISTRLVGHPDSAQRTPVELAKNVPPSGRSWSGSQQLGQNQRKVGGLRRNALAEFDPDLANFGPWLRFHRESGASVECLCLAC